jgi:hypothetical protein
MKVLGVVGALVGIVGGLLGILVYFRDPGAPDENQAQIFLESYYSTAPSDPSSSWQMTTTSYREQALVGALDDYTKYWHSMQTVTVDDLGLSKDPQRSGWWKARVTFHDKSGRVTRPYFQFQLVCSWQANLPWNGCDSHHVLLNKARQYKPADFK